MAQAPSSLSLPLVWTQARVSGKNSPIFLVSVNLFCIASLGSRASPVATFTARPLAWYRLPFSQDTPSTFPWTSTSVLPSGFLILCSAQVATASTSAILAFFVLPTMARGKWRERIRGVRDRLFGRRDLPPPKDELASCPPDSPIPSPVRPERLQGMQMGPTQLAYHIPPELQDNLRRDRERNTSIFDFTRPMPASETPSRPKRRHRARSSSGASSPTARRASGKEQEAKSPPTVRFATRSSSHKSQNRKATSHQHCSRDRGRPGISYPVTPVETPDAFPSPPPSPSPPSQWCCRACKVSRESEDGDTSGQDEGHPPPQAQVRARARAGARTPVLSRHQTYAQTQTPPQLRPQTLERDRSRSRLLGVRLRRKRSSSKNLRGWNPGLSSAFG
jgi:hypothetical protein